MRSASAFFCWVSLSTSASNNLRSALSIAARIGFEACSYTSPRKSSNRSTPISFRSPLCPTTSCTAVFATSATSTLLGNSMTTSSFLALHQPLALCCLRLGNSAISSGSLTTRIGVFNFSDSILACNAFACGVVSCGSILPCSEVFSSPIFGFTKSFTIFAAEESLELLRASALSAGWCR